ncbi:unnamed protein product [Lampetra planeri]
MAPAEPGDRGTPAASHLQPQAHATPHGCNSRFRVVKLVEKEPFKKGRWNCTDFYEKDKELVLGMPGAPPGIGWAPDNLQSVAASNVGSDALLQAGQQQQQQQPLQVPQQGYGICLVEEGTDNPQLQKALGFHGGLLDQQIEQQQQQMPSFGVQMQPPQLPPQAPLPNLSELQMRANSPHPPVLLQQQQQQQAWQQRMPPHPQTADGNFLQHSLASSAVHKPASPIAAGFPAVPKSPPSAVTQQLNSVLAQMHSSQGQQHSPGASMVAIDNKIEQAMDLVKSHLMFAVREEVEILREQIKELVDKNNHLEQENQALRGLANPEQLQELLSQLPDSTPPPAVAAGDGQNGGNNGGGGGAPPAAQQPPQGNAVPSA